MQLKPSPETLAKLIAVIERFMEVHQLLYTYHISSLIRLVWFGKNEPRNQCDNRLKPALACLLLLIKTSSNPLQKEEPMTHPSLGII